MGSCAVNGAKEEVQRGTVRRHDRAADGGDGADLPGPGSEDGTLGRLPQPPRARQPSGALASVVTRLADALGVEPEHFREYRLRVITDRLEAMPDFADRLYKRLASSRRHVGSSAMRAMVLDAPGERSVKAELPARRPRPGQVRIRVARVRRLPDRSPHPRRRAAGAQAAARPRPPDRRHRRSRGGAVRAGRARRRPVARLDVRRVPLLPQRAREPLRPRPLHRLHARRRLRRGGRGRCPLLPSAAGRPVRRGARAAALRGADRVPGAARGRRRRAPRPVRVRRRRRTSSRSSPSPRGGASSRSRGRATTRRSRWPATLGAEWAGASGERPEELDAAIIFAPAGELVPEALAAVAKGGTVVCAGIHMSDDPVVPVRAPLGRAGPAVGREPHPRATATSCSRPSASIR